MKRDLLFVAIVSSAAACYDPTLGRCTVRCQGDEPCPDNLTCASDNFCHAASNDPPDCNGQGGDGGMGSNMVTLTVMPTGSGTGTVSSASPAIECSTAAVGGPNCTATVKVDTVVTLTEAADASSVFGTWGDGASACNGQICMITVKDSTTVTADFDAAANVIIDLVGEGDGAVTSTPSGLTAPGMSCNDESTDDSVQCTATFAIGTNVTLIASANTSGDGSVFDSWQQEDQPVPCTGDPGDPTCTFQLQSNVEFAAQFDQ